MLVVVVVVVIVIVRIAEDDGAIDRLTGRVDQLEDRLAGGDADEPGGVAAVECTEAATGTPNATAMPCSTPAPPH